jgi:hypothetical protein
MGKATVTERVVKVASGTGWFVASIVVGAITVAGRALGMRDAETSEGIEIAKGAFVKGVENIKDAVNGTSDKP